MGKTHEDDEIEIDLMELFYALKKRILVILAVMVLGAVAAGAYTKLLVTPMYSATSTMLVLTKETTLASLAESVGKSADSGLQHAAEDPHGDAGCSGQSGSGYVLSAA